MPTIESPPAVTLPVNTPTISGVEEEIRESGIFEAAEKPFFAASGVVVSLLFLTMFLSLCSVGISLYHLFKDCAIRFNGQLLLLIAAMSCNSLAVAIYLLLTVSYLNGGYYVDGVWITALMSITGLLCILVSFAADVEIKSNAYARLPEIQMSERTEAILRGNGSLPSEGVQIVQLRPQLYGSFK
jgi:hypothetical protein